MNAHVTQTPPHGTGDGADDMLAEIDFFDGVRGKFYSPNVHLRLPIYLDAGTQTYLADHARAKGTDIAGFVNQLLKKDFELIEAAR